MTDIQELTQNVLDKVSSKHEATYNDVAKELEEKKAVEQKKIDEQTEAKKERLDAAFEAEVQRQKQSYVNEKRNQSLKAKQALIDDVYSDAISRMNQMDSSQYRQMIKGAVDQLQTSEPITIVQGDKSKHILMDQDRQSLQSEYPQLDFSEDTLKNRSGFVLASKGMDYNFTFEAIIDELKAELAPEIAKRGF